MWKRFKALTEALRALMVDERGAAVTEYGLILALIAVGLIYAATVVGQHISALFDYVGSFLP